MRGLCCFIHEHMQVRKLGGATACCLMLLYVNDCQLVKPRNIAGDLKTGREQQL